MTIYEFYKAAFRLENLLMVRRRLYKAAVGSRFSKILVGVLNTSKASNCGPSVKLVNVNAAYGSKF